MPYCPNCGLSVQSNTNFCPICGTRLPVLNVQLHHQAPSQANLQPPSVITYQFKNEGIAALLALFVGIVLLGVGHIYIGKTHKGFSLMATGLVLDVVAFFALGSNIAIAFIVGLIFLTIWVGSIREVRNLAEEYNRHLKATGQPPW